MIKPNSARRTRRKHSDEFKAKVALEAIREDKTMSELCQIHGISDAQINDWKKQLLENATGIFKGSKRQRDTGPDLTLLHAKIGQLTLEIAQIQHFDLGRVDWVAPFPKPVKPVAFP